MSKRHRTRILLAAALLLCGGITADAGQAPPAICRDCADLARRIRDLQKAMRSVSAQLEEARQREVATEIRRDENAADLTSSLLKQPPTPASQAAVAKYARYHKEYESSLANLRAEIAALEARLQNLARQIAEMSAELNACNRKCGEAPPGTPIQPPVIVDEQVPDARCDACRPLVERVTQLQAQRRRVVEEMAALEAARDEFDAALDKLNDDLSALEAGGQDMSRVTVNGMPVMDFFERALNEGFNLTTEIGRRRDAWRRLDEQIGDALEKLTQCNAKCGTETGGLFTRPATYYALGGAAAGVLLAAGGGDAPVTATAIAPVTTAGPPAPAPAPPPSQPPPAAPPPAIDGDYVCTSCAVMMDNGRHNPAIRLCEGVTALFRAQQGSISLSHPAPFVPIAGDFNASTGAFSAGGRGTVAGLPNVSVRGDGTADARGGRITFDYTMGAAGELPGGQPIVYRLTLQRR